ncbi:MAG: ATP-binding cassette domain-containing protein [Rickettsiales bacterium]
MRPAIELIHLTKLYTISHFRRKLVLNDVNLRIPSDVSIGIMGKNGAGKSTLVNLISGVEFPSSGRIARNGLRISWPIGRGGVQGALSAYNNIKFICRVTGANFRKSADMVADLTELGAYMDMPVHTYSSGMKARLMLAMSLIPEYDCYLVDEGFNAGTPKFTEKFNEVFSRRRERANMLCISHNPAIIRRFCDKAALLRDGKLVLFEDIEEAVEIFKTL